MSVNEIVLAVFVGVFVLFSTFFLAYGALTYWQERDWLPAGIFTVIAFGMLFAYGYVVIGKVFG